MSGISNVVGGALSAIARCAVVCLVITLLLMPLAAQAAEDQQPKKTMPIQATVSVEWDIESGGTRNQGSMTLRMRGTAHLAEDVSVMDPAAPPGTIITYAAKGVGVSYTYSETITQEHPPQGCPALMAEYQGSGGFTLEEVNTAMTSGLNIRKMGSLIPKEALAFAPPEAKEMMIDYYDFFAVAMKQKVQGRKRGWNDCNFQPATREFNPGALTIRFRIIDEGKMEGSREWSVSKNSGGPTFGLRLSDLPAKMERRPLVPEPDGGGDVSYAVSWNFGEVDPYVQVQRKEGGQWVPITEEPVQVKVGEKIELRGMVMPEEQDTGRGRWTVPGRTIEEFVVEGDRGYADWLEDSELETQELTFHWWDGEDGLEVEYETTSSKGKKLTGSAAFDIKEPDTVLRAYLAEGEFEAVVLEDPGHDITVYDTRELVYGASTGQSIRFCHDPLPSEFRPGSTQFLQYVWTSGRVTAGKVASGGMCMQIENEGLDATYPYGPGPEVRDSPGVELNAHDLSVSMEYQFTMQLMYKPGTPGAIFVPLSEMDWLWIGRCSRATEHDHWTIGDCIAEAPATGVPAQTWMEWDRITTGNEVWDACP